MGRTGNEGYARAKWGKLSAAEKAAIQDRLGRPRSWAADMWAGKWLECRVWEETPPVAGSAKRPEQVFIREGTPEWRAWQRHLVATTGRGTPMDSRGGWYFPSKLPLLEAETPPKAHAHSSLRQTLPTTFHMMVPKPARSNGTRPSRRIAAALFEPNPAATGDIS
jgi:hypothetical protein